MSQDIYVIVEHLRGQVADITYVMLAGARVLSQGSGGKVKAVLCGHNAQALAKSLAADEVLYLDSPALADFTSEAYQKALAPIITEHQPRAVLFGSTSIGADLASSLSVRLSLPLVNSCSTFEPDGKFVSQICGGKIMADGALPAPSSLVTMIPGGYKPEQGQTAQPSTVTSVPVSALDGLRVVLKNYIEPEAGDVDISKEAVIISVGRGVQNQDNIALVEELAQALGGVVAGSRPVVDQGWLPASRLIGKSGKAVKPKLYLALGISGAPEHVEAITGSEMIVAVNTDPTAPIFSLAKYGSEQNMFDLLPDLVEQVRQAKG